MLPSSGAVPNKDISMSIAFSHCFVYMKPRLSAEAEHAINSRSALITGNISPSFSAFFHSYLLSLTDGHFVPFQLYTISFLAILKMKTQFAIAAVAAFASSVLSAPAPEELNVRRNGRLISLRQSGNSTSSGATSSITATPANKATTAGGSLPASSGTSVLKAAQTIAAGESFDGGMVMFDRGVSCTGQAEGGDADAVFQLENGASISNVIVGPNQIEGIHCQGACELTNVWWSAVCEDAFTVKTQAAGETTKITGGGAFGADDKVLQHNGGGTISVSGFTVESFGKLYRSCGNCDSMTDRHVILDSISATAGKELAGRSTFSRLYRTFQNGTLTSLQASTRTLATAPPSPTSKHQTLTPSVRPLLETILAMSQPKTPTVKGVTEAMASSACTRALTSLLRRAPKTG